MKKWCSIVVLAAGFMISCAGDKAPADSSNFSNYLHASAKFVKQRLPVADPPMASISELALSIPTFEGSGSGGKTSLDGESWVLFGDGAQCPVLAKRLTAKGQNPVRLKLVQGASPPEDPAHATSYELEKISGGWEILSAHKGKADDLLKWPMD